MTWNTASGTDRRTRGRTSVANHRTEQSPANRRCGRTEYDRERNSSARADELEGQKCGQRG